MVGHGQLALAFDGVWLAMAAHGPITLVPTFGGLCLAMVGHGQLVFAFGGVWLAMADHCPTSVRLWWVAVGHGRPWPTCVGLWWRVAGHG